MWIPEEFVDNDLFEMIRDEGGDQVRLGWGGCLAGERLGTVGGIQVTLKHLAGDAGGNANARPGHGSIRLNA